VSNPADSLQDRYGKAPGSSRLVVAVVVGAIVVTSLVWLVWAGFGGSDPAVSSSEVSKDQINAHEVWITFQIKYGDGPVDATCSARAVASDGEEVGRTSFAPSRQAQPDQTFRTTFRTTRMADSIEWLGCTAPGQPRPH
jgi:hypothetical protein